MTGKLRRTVNFPMIVSAVCILLLAAPISSELATAQQLPPSPDPVSVTLAANSTAVLVLDLNEGICGPAPSCVAVVPQVASLLANARAAGALVAYPVPSNVSPYLAEVAPQSGDPQIQGVGQNRFFDSELDDLLRTRRISTVVLVGWRINGSLLYTAHGATDFRYTVVVADDGTGASQDYDVAVGRYQLLTQIPGNPTNAPLQPGAVTLSRTDLIAFD